MNLLRRLLGRPGTGDTGTLLKQLENTYDIPHSVQAAEALGRERQSYNQHVVDALAAAARSAVSQWEAQKMVLSSTHGVTPDKIVLAPHADPSRITIAAIHSLQQIARDGAQDIRDAAQSRVNELQSSIKDNWLAKQIEFG